MQRAESADLALGTFRMLSRYLDTPLVIACGATGLFEVDWGWSFAESMIVRSIASDSRWPRPESACIWNGRDS